MKRFNSGIGGYTCDYCGILLWSGFSEPHDSLIKYYYNHKTKDDIIVEGNEAFCNDKCYTTKYANYNYID